MFQAEKIVSKAVDRAKTTTTETKNTESEKNKIKQKTAATKIKFGSSLVVQKQKT